MKSCVLIATISTLLSLMLTVSTLAQQPILVRIDQNGRASSSSICDGEMRVYEDGSKTIDGNLTQLVVFAESTHLPDKFLKKMETGVKWTLAPWSATATIPVIASPAAPADSLLVFVSAKGKVTQVTDLAGQKPSLPKPFLEALKNNAVALVSPGSHCCFAYCGGGWCCRCEHCPWGCDH